MFIEFVKPLKISPIEKNIYEEYEIVLENLKTGKTRLVYQVELEAPEHKGLANENDLLKSLGITTCKRKHREDEKSGNTSF